MSTRLDDDGDNKHEKRKEQQQEQRRRRKIVLILLTLCLFLLVWYVEHNERDAFYVREIDDVFDEDGWIYVGYFNSDVDGSLNVDANRQILIIDDMAYFDEGGGAMLLSLPFCCMGFIGLIIAVTVLITAKEKVQGTVANPGIVFIEPTPPEEKVQVGAEGGSEWWEKESKPE